MAPKRTFSVLLVTLIVSGAFFGYLGTGKAESIPKPSIPDYTIAYLDKSYDVPPTTTIDPYNGQTTTVPGSHVKASVIEIRIKNEAFTPFLTDSGYHQINYYYNIRWKGHFEDNWHDIFKANYGPGYLPRSNGTETVFSTDYPYTVFEKLDTADFRVGDQIDFQVEAMTGYVMDPGPFEAEVFEGQVSDWSNTQTLTIPGTSTPVSPSPTVPEYQFLAILPLLSGIFVVAVLVRKKKVLA